MTRHTEIENALRLCEELTRLDREDESKHRAAVRTGDAAIASRTAARWSATRAELVNAQLALAALRPENPIAEELRIRDIERRGRFVS